MRDNILTGLKELKLPRYKDLPDFGIYSEQLVEIVKRHWKRCLIRTIN